MLYAVAVHGAACAAAQIEALDLGVLQKVKVWHDNKGLSKPFSSPISPPSPPTPPPPSFPRENHTAVTAPPPHQQTECALCEWLRSIDLITRAPYIPFLISSC